MTHTEALKLIDDHKNQLLDPVEMLAWTHLRVIIANIKYIEWVNANYRAEKVLSR